MSKALKNIREKIDALDDQIHNVLMERAGLIDQIVAEKRKQNMPFVHPAREAQMIRRLLGRHDGPLPEEAIVRIWRELVGAVSLVQTGLRVSVCLDDHDDPFLWEMARNYFGSVVPMHKLSNALLAVGSIREGESSFAVLAWPHDDEDTPWWVHLYNQDGHDIKIVCALPYGFTAEPGKTKPDGALVIAKTGFMPSGDDHSFIVLDLNVDISRARLVDVLGQAEIEPLSIITHQHQPGVRSLHLIEVKDYIVQGDPRLSSLTGGFDDDPDLSYKMMGGYPVPPVYT